MSFNIEISSFPSPGAILISFAVVKGDRNMVSWELNLCKSNEFSSSSHVSALSNFWWLSLFSDKNNVSFGILFLIPISQYNNCSVLNTLNLDDLVLEAQPQNMYDHGNSVYVLNYGKGDHYYQHHAGEH